MFISTPHPIANMSTTQEQLLNTIEQIGNLKLRTEFHTDTASKYDNEKEYHKEKTIQYLKNVSNPDIENIIGELIDKVHNKTHTLEETQIALAKLVITMGIPTKVVDKDIQTAQNQIKENNLKKIKGVKTKSWVNIDADGDENPLIGIINKYGVEEGKTFLEIFDTCQKHREKIANEGIYESRISCENKKEIIVVQEQLSNLPDVKNIGYVADILDDGNFEKQYDEFKEFLKKEQYQKVKGKFTNSPLDFVMRICAPAFLKSETKKEMLYQLM